jgi:type VI secretion system protein ImpH
VAGPDWSSPDAVALGQALAEAPHAFGFYAALRRLDAAFAAAPRIGEADRPSEEAVRLGQLPSVVFAPSTLAGFAMPKGDTPARLQVHFLGLFGPNGPLPLHLTEYARDRIRHASDRSFAAFADLFHHRLLSLFYRAWAEAEPAVSFDRPQDDKFGAWVASLIGLGTPSFRDRDAMPDLAKLHFAGLLSLQTRHPDGLASLLATFFALPVGIEEFAGEWVALAQHQQCRLGDDPETGTLGGSITVGSHVWSAAHRFTIRFGPLDLAGYRRMLPGGDSLARLIAAVRAYSGDEWAWQANLVLRAEEVPPLKLGGDAAHLGWTTWIGTRDPEAGDAGDLYLEPLAA